MFSGLRFTVALLLVLCMGVFLAGCTAVSIGESRYTGSGIEVHITNQGEPAETYLQVTVYEIRDLRQQEAATLNTTVRLGKGENVALVPGTLPPGSYKLYIYLIQNYDRKSAAIRDIVVT
jgi:hypothetical protein